MQQFSNTLRVVVTAVIASMGSPALAEPPMQVDDAGTLGKGGMKIEGVLDREDKARGAELGFGYGPIENVEIGLAFARATDRADQPSTKVRGLGIIIKWIPIQNDTGWSLGMRLGYDRARAHIRSAIPPDPERETEKAYSLAGLASYRFESGRALHVNLGSTRVKVGGETDTVAGWGIGFEQPLMAKLKLTAEVFGEEGSGPDKALGLRYEVFEGFKISGAIGRGNERGFGQIGFAWEF